MCRIVSDGINSTPVPLFIFGDFNFRLNTFDIIHRLTQDIGEDQVLVQSKKFSVPDHDAFFKHSNWVSFRKIRTRLVHSYNSFSGYQNCV